ncbi:hypothetical protein LTR37_019799 [Vermiconidia calcicola]|uniref:Uncharacterized protein n=1 Tax=Vermiconidia calcicola TaxID=1690605 RepID=A0ACC3MEC1_9PEZI|nr:hypothetical protein LTR37_019799 [Vermiconidia calcicola]
MPRPKFDDLPLSPNDPKGSAWGLYGKDDELGTLNLVTEDVVKAAVKEVKHGIVVPLNLLLHEPTAPMNPTRIKCEHKILNREGVFHDDELLINTQSSSQMDGLRHYPYQDSGLFYGGVTRAEISGDKKGNKLGIHNQARKGIVSRGVLLDWKAYANKHNISHSAFDSHAITLHDLLEIAKDENVTLREGDILILRTGWTEEFNKLSEADQVGIAQRSDRRQIGVEPSQELLRWHWDTGIAMVATDTVAYELTPFIRPWGYSCHEIFLNGWGMMIGELWDLEQLAERCKGEGRWTFMLSSQPLNLEGGVATTANALAIF